MKVKSFFAMLLTLLTLVIVGCGGDGGGSTTTIKGTSAASPIIDGIVTFFSIDSQGNDTLLTTTPAEVRTKAPFGNYSAAIGYNGPLLVKVTGGTYTDEASGLTLTNVEMQAAVPNATGTIANVSVTPHTTVAVKLAQQATSGTPAENITAANANVAKALRLPVGFDIINTPVDNPNYAFALAAFSQGALNTVTAAGGNINDPAALAAASAANVAALSTVIDASGTVTDPATNQGITQAIQDAANNPIIVVPPIIVLTDPAGVSITASPATGVINNTVTITANVSAVGSTSTVPDGTVVTFTTSAGTITGSAATTAGVATATLSGISTPQAVTVSAAVGTITSSPLTVNFIADPTVPGAISITANPTTISGAGTSTITATITAAGGASFTVQEALVTFATTVGTITPSATTVGGVATATLTIPAGIPSGTASVTATVNGITSAPALVTLIAQPTLAIVKVATTGTLPLGSVIGGITAHVIANPSAGLTVIDTAPGVVPAQHDVVTSGVGIGSTLVPNVVNVADITLGLINATGIAIGEFATLNYHVAVGTFPAAGDFTIAPGFTVIDTNGAAIAGVSVVIQSVTPQ
jgi:adhesin/invasin